VKARFKQATPEEIAELTALRRSRGIKLLPTRDTNGFRRQIVALAPNGALISLHNGDGRVMWRRALGAGLDPHGDPAAAYNYSAVLPWRPAGAAHDPAAEHALVLGTASSATASGGTKTRAVVVNLYTGAVDSDTVLPFAAAHMLPLPSAAAADGADRHGHGHGHEPSAMVLVDAAGSVAHVFPDTHHARAAAYADRPRISYFTVDQAGGLLRASTRPTLKRRTDSARLYEHSP